MGVIRSYTRKVGISLRGDSKSGVALGIIGVAPRDGEKVVAIRVGEKGCLRAATNLFFVGFTMVIIKGVHRII